MIICYNECNLFLTKLSINLGASLIHVIVGLLMLLTCHDLYIVHHFDILRWLDSNNIFLCHL